MGRFTILFRFLFLCLLIPPLLVNNSFVTDFKEKANLFNEYFCKQCTPVANDSTLTPFLETSNEILSYLKIIASDIGKIIKALNLNKAHGHDDISIRMLKLLNQPSANRFI